MDWSAIDSIARYVVNFIVGIILARLFSPEDYGLLGIVVIFINVCNAIIEGGFTSFNPVERANEGDYEATFIVMFGETKGI